MKNAIKLSLSILVAISTSTAMAAAGTARNAREVRAKMEERSKEARERITNAGKTTAQQAEIARDLSALTNGQIATREMTTALNKTVIVKDADGDKSVSLMSIAQSIRETKEATKEINQNELDVAGKAHLDQLNRAFEVNSKFLSLASRMSRDAASKEVQAFNKQLSLISDMMTKMDTAELQSHLDVMELTVENALRDRKLTADQAYAQALQFKFKDKYAQKLEEILGCVR